VKYFSEKNPEPAVFFFEKLPGKKFKKIYRIPEKI